MQMYSILLRNRCQVVPFVRNDDKQIILFEATNPFFVSLEALSVYTFTYSNERYEIQEPKNVLWAVIIRTILTELLYAISLKPFCLINVLVSSKIGTYKFYIQNIILYKLSIIWCHKDSVPDARCQTRKNTCLSLLQAVLIQGIVLPRSLQLFPRSDIR